MNLLIWDGMPSSPPGVVLLFGSGLIGGAVASALISAGLGVICQRFNWNWPRPSASDTQAIERAAILALAERRNANFTVIWAAGRSGFASSSEDMSLELTALELVMQTARKIGAECAPRNRGFVHISSAGGLFEGQVACGLDAAPRPIRPYGHGKLAQEKLIQDSDVLGTRLILRPSSVYGYNRDARRGLISTLAVTAIQQTPATIFGSLTTLRDYLYAPDIGRYIAARVINAESHWPSKQLETCVLASARPASVFEVLRLVEDHVGRVLNVRLDPNPSNALSNSFLPSALPKGFRITSLENGIASTVRAIAGERIVGVDL